MLFAKRITKMKVEFHTTKVMLTPSCQNIYMNVLHSLRFELELLLNKRVKFEIEALSVHSLTFLSHEYLPSKINNDGYIWNFSIFVRFSSMRSYYFLCARVNHFKEQPNQSLLSTTSCPFMLSIEFFTIMVVDIKLP